MLQSAGLMPSSEFQSEKNNKQLKQFLERNCIKLMYRVTKKFGTRLIGKVKKLTTAKRST